MKYRKGFVYQVAEDELFKTGIVAVEQGECLDDFICLENGLLTVKAGYAWDGPSGPTKIIVDLLEKIPFFGERLAGKFLESFLTPSLGHDAKYQLIRREFVSMSYRDLIDKELKTDCLDRGMYKVRANYVYKGVKEFGEPSADPKNVKKIYEAP